MDSNQIIVLGSCSVDFTTYAERLPKAGETLHGYKFTTSNGGKGANQCVAAAKLGGKTAMVAKVGDDSWGKEYINNFQNCGIDTKYVSKVSNVSTGIAQINVSKSGENQIVIVAGANKTLSVKDVEDAKDVLVGASVLVCQLETPVEATLRAFELCQGIKILNAAPGLVNLNRHLLSLTTVLCVNESEASIITGKPVETLGDVKEAIGDLLTLECKTVIITLGANGAVFASQTEPKPIHVFCDKVVPVDTTGAGDGFIGALATLLSKNENIPFSTVVGASCKFASMSVTKEGTQLSYPNLNVNTLLQCEYITKVL